MDFRWSLPDREHSRDQTGHQRDGCEPIGERERGPDSGGEEREGEEGAHGQAPNQRRAIERPSSRRAIVRIASAVVHPHFVRK